VARDGELVAYYCSRSVGIGVLSSFVLFRRTKRELFENGATLETCNER